MLLPSSTSFLLDAENAALKLKQEIDQLKQIMAATMMENAKLSKLAYYDHLTGIANRRHFDEVLDKEWHRAIRQSRDGGHCPISVLFVDLDYFKSINDASGHDAGDRVLREIGHNLSQVRLRLSDLVARYGGDEFAVVLIGCDMAGATQIAKLVQSAIHAVATPVHRIMSASIGIASMVPVEGSELTELLNKADTAVYWAKERGRDRIESYDPISQLVVGG